MTRHCARKSGLNAAQLMRKILRERPHDLCEFKSGRLTPYIVKAFVSAKYSANIRRISAQRPAGCPAQCPCSFRAISTQQPSNSRATSAHCPCSIRALSGNVHATVALQSAWRPRNVHKLGQSTTAHSPNPWTVRVQSVAATSPQTDRDRDLSMTMSSPRPNLFSIQRHSMDYDTGMARAIREWLQKHRALWTAAQEPSTE